MVIYADNLFTRPILQTRMHISVKIEHFDNTVLSLFINYPSLHWILNRRIIQLWSFLYCFTWSHFWVDSLSPYLVKSHWNMQFSILIRTLFLKIQRLGPQFGTKGFGNLKFVDNNPYNWIWIPEFGNAVFLCFSELKSIEIFYRIIF